MDEGKKLLSSIIEARLNELTNLDISSLIIGNINISELLTAINKDENNFFMVTDEIIAKVIEISNVKNKETFRINVRSARDLLVGKKDYNLRVRLTQEHQDAIKVFWKNLEKLVNSLNPDVIRRDDSIARIKELKKQVDNNYIINDFSIVEDITFHYDNLNYDKNMVIIMKYINELNLNLMKMRKKNAPIFDIQMIRRPKIDARIKEILKKLDIKQKEIPNFLLSELKAVNPEEFVKTFALIKKNKAENGGILHFIEKENITYRLALLLYATEESVLNVVESLRGTNNLVDIPLLKLIINKLPSVFLVKNNTYYQPKYKEFMANINLLKDLDINYKTLISRNPLFMITDNKGLNYTLDYLSNLGADKKTVVNRCYKTLSISSALLIENVEIMHKHNINIQDFFSSQNTNYNLLKMQKLDSKLKNLKNIHGIDITNIEALNKIIIAKVYRESTVGYINWGEQK